MAWHFLFQLDLKNLSYIRPTGILKGHLEIYLFYYIMYYIVKINGIYDIICSLCILRYIHIPYIETIHLNMIKNNETNIIFQRYYAYWILTYGYMRLTASDINFIKMSYLIEALCTLNELLYYTNDINIHKSLFVIIVCLLFGIVI